MDDDKPIRIVILGAGPIGVEAALYARFLGFEAFVLEKHDVAHNMRDSSEPMPQPFSQCATTLGLAALEAHGADNPPDPEELLTRQEFATRYLLPLSKTDLLADRITTGIEAIAVTRSESDDEHGLAVHTRSDGNELLEPADVVVDATSPLDLGVADPLFEKLAIDRCAKTGSYVGANSGFQLADKELGSPAALVTGEEDLFVIGRKSLGRRIEFQLSLGHEQIKSLFSILGERDDLDLYSSIRPSG